MTTPTEPTPAELRTLAADTAALADRIRTVNDRMGASDDEEVRHVRYQLDHAGSTVREAAKAIEETAGDLARVRTARDPALCGVPWGVCPEHGNTLTSTDGTTYCRSARCGRTWTYDRVTLPCTEPISHRGVDQKGTEFLVCNGHALDAEKRLEGATITRIAPLV